MAFCDTTKALASAPLAAGDKLQAPKALVAALAVAGRSEIPKALGSLLSAAGGRYQVPKAVAAVLIGQEGLKIPKGLGSALVTAEPMEVTKALAAAILLVQVSPPAVPDELCIPFRQSGVPGSVTLRTTVVPAGGARVAIQPVATMRLTVLPSTDRRSPVVAPVLARLSIKPEECIPVPSPIAPPEIGQIPNPDQGGGDEQNNLAVYQLADFDEMGDALAVAAGPDASNDPTLWTYIEQDDNYWATDDWDEFTIP